MIIRMDARNLIFLGYHLYATCAKNRDNSLAIKQTVFQHGNSSVKTIAPR